MAINVQTTSFSSQDSRLQLKLTRDFSKWNLGSRSAWKKNLNVEVILQKWGLLRTNFCKIDSYFWSHKFRNVLRITQYYGIFCNSDRLPWFRLEKPLLFCLCIDITRICEFLWNALNWHPAGKFYPILRQKSNTHKEI